MKVYIVIFKTEQADKRVGAVYRTQKEAQAECDRLDEASSWAHAMLVTRELEDLPSELVRHDVIDQ